MLDNKMEPIHILEHIDRRYLELVLRKQVFKYDRENDRVAVIVEPRRHAMLCKVIRVFMSILGLGWNLHVFTAQENTEWLKERLPGCSFRATPLNRNSITTQEYSDLLMREDFWGVIPEENILVFQTDSILFKPGIDQWVDSPEHGFDYVGANYYSPDHMAPKIGGIQGGLSLRKKSAMIECIQKVTKNIINYYRSTMGLKDIDDIAEDVFFTHACEILHKRVPSVEQRRLFSIEADYHPDTLGHHGLKCRYLTEEQQKELVR